MGTFFPNLTVFLTLSPDKIFLQILFENPQQRLINYHFQGNKAKLMVMIMVVIIIIILIIIIITITIIIIIIIIMRIIIIIIIISMIVIIIMMIMIIHQNDHHHHRIAFPASSPSHSASSPESDKITLHRQIDQCASDEGGKPKVYKLLEKLKVDRVFANPKILLHDLISKLTDMSSEGGGTRN